MVSSDFCTYFDHRYAARGLALYRSLKEHCPDFRLWILCMDSGAHTLLSRLRLPEVRLISIEEFEREDKELVSAKKDRSTVEYYFTCTPSLPLFVFRNFSDIDLITYLDADMYFFSDPSPALREIADYSIGITEHRYAPGSRRHSAAGIYNVGWLSFRRDADAFSCLNWWRERCLEWCYDRLEADRFADQKYLDDWPSRFRGVRVLEHKGVNVAPWNLDNYTMAARKGELWVDDEPLVLFHFHGLRQLTKRLYDTGLGYHRAKLRPPVRSFIYEPYLKALLEIEQDLTRRFDSSFQIQSVRSEQGANASGALSKAWRFFSILYRVILPRNYLRASRDMPRQRECGMSG